MHFIFKVIVLLILTIAFYSCSSPIYRPVMNNSLEATKKGEVAVLGGLSVIGAQGNLAYSPKDNFFVRSGYYSNIKSDKYKVFNIGVGYVNPLIKGKEINLDHYNTLDFHIVNLDRFGNNQTFEYQKLMGIKNQNIGISTGLKASFPLFNEDLKLVNKLGVRVLHLNIKEIVLRLQAYENVIQDIRNFDGKFIVDLNYELNFKYKNFTYINGINLGLYESTYLFPFEIWAGVSMSFGGKVKDSAN